VKKDAVPKERERSAESIKRRVGTDKEMAAHMGHGKGEIRVEGIGGGGKVS